MGLGGRHVGGLDGSEKSVPLQRFQRGSDGVGPVSGRDAQNGIRSRAQLMQKVADSVEWPFGKGGIRSQLRQQEIVGPDHLKYGAVGPASSVRMTSSDFPTSARLSAGDGAGN